MKGCADMILLPVNVVKRIRKNEYLKGLNVQKLRDNPVCPRCEHVALRDIGYTKNKTATCTHCGYHGRMEYTLEEYAKRKMYR